MKKTHLTVIAIATLLITTCGRTSHRAEIEQRKAALRQHQDSSLLAAQQELAVVDSTLEAVKQEYERKKAEVDRHKADLSATAEELTELTLLGLKRDSLQGEWQLLGAKIKYIRQKQQESSQEP